MEHHTFNSRLRVLNERSAEFYQHIEKLENNDKKRLISGVHLKLAPGNEIYADFCQGSENAAYPYTDVIFVFDSLVVAAHCRLPSCNVTIYARRLEFVDQGCIDSSGLSFKGLGPGTAGETKRDGKDGEDAGHIDIACHTLIKSPDHRAEQAFLAIGGDGQDATEGRKGEDGAVNVWQSGSKEAIARYQSFDDILKDWVQATSGKNEGFDEGDRADYLRFCRNADFDPTKPVKEGFYIRSAQMNVYGMGWKDRSFNPDDTVVPSNGGDAVEPGKPGNGGRGGDVALAVALKPEDLSGFNADGSGGQPGAATQDVAGGQPGQPVKTILAHFLLQTVKRSTMGISMPPGYKAEQSAHEQKTAVAGKGFKGKAGVPGNGGQYFYTDGAVVEAGRWLHPALAQTLLRYVSDAYLEGRIDEIKLVGGSVQAVLDVYVTTLRDIGETFTPSSDREDAPFAHWRLKENRYTAYSLVLNKLLSLQQNLLRGVDYYGNLPGFMPVISASGAKLLFESSLDQALTTIVLSRQLEKTYLKREDNRNLMSRMIRDTSKAINEQIQARQEAIAGVDAKEVAVEALRREEEVLQTELNKRKAELLEKAKDQEEKARMIRLAANGVGMACRLIPVGQPVLGVVGGTAADIAGSYLSGKETGEGMDGSKLKGLAEVYTTYKATLRTKNFDHIATQRAEFQARLTKLNTLDTERIELTPEQKADWTRRQNEVRAQLALIEQRAGLSRKAVANLTAGLKDLKVDSKVIDKLYKKFLNQDPGAKELIKKIKTTNEKKRKAVAELEKHLQALVHLDYQIEEAALNITQLMQARIDGGGLNDKAIMPVFKTLRNDAFERINYFQYLVVKAYEAEFLEPYDKAPLARRTFIEKLDDMLKGLVKDEDFLAQFQHIVAAMKNLLIAHHKLSKEALARGARFTTSGTTLSYSLMFSGAVEGQENPYLSPLNEAILQDPNGLANVVFPFEDFFDKRMLRRQTHAKLASIELQELAFRFVDADSGAPITDRYDNPLIDRRSVQGEADCIDLGDEQFIIDSNAFYKLYLAAPKDGLVRVETELGDSVPYYFRPANDWVWTWGYQFYNGAKPENTHLRLQNSSMAAVLGKGLSESVTGQSKSTFFAPVPLEGDYQLTIEVPATPITLRHVRPAESGGRESQYRSVMPQVHRLVFKFEYFAQSTGYRGL